MEPAKVKTHESPAERGKFQSAEARAAAKGPVTSALDDAPVAALVGSIDENTPQVAVDWDEENKMVTVTPRITVARTRIGQHWYSFAANKKCVVPNFVRRHLEEKGVC